MADRVGVIEGGTAHNITAKDCKFAMDFRVVPGEDKDKWGTAYLKKVREVEKQMQDVVPETYIETSTRFDVPALQPEKDGEAEQIVRLEHRRLVVLHILRMDKLDVIDHVQFLQQNRTCQSVVITASHQPVLLF